MSSKEDAAGTIILAYATAHATVAAILANTVAGDAPILFALTCLMIYQLANLCGKDFDAAAITAVAGNLVGAVAGTYLAAKLVTWIPGWGNALNATITFGITQVIGWAAFAMFSQGISQESAIKYGESRKISKEEMDNILSRMSYDDRSRYDSLQNRLKDFNISDAERQNIVSEMAELIERYR
jgi:uncharacterized protein (DUF697 family)